MANLQYTEWTTQTTLVVARGVDPYGTGGHFPPIFVHGDIPPIF